ncbi:hypothetical protein BC1002_4187 [Paraburkholderia atlantica]|uniref:Uncharacterized protein n=1 Tax=Paraburkholderia atlantica TaxID=2654982 RepID=D5WI87_PARAM|nr:hypothetical protein [Paraburkholderia atlantica]ADG18182.1 hypothetical protein BC1002_4187 [Paraburkholderia atlantica]
MNKRTDFIKISSEFVGQSSLSRDQYEDFELAMAAGIATARELENP